ncbi:MAG: hypothetical protein ACO1N5_17615 [Noviherbaspirillum sp.]
MSTIPPDIDPPMPAGPAVADNARLAMRNPAMAIQASGIQPDDAPPTESRSLLDEHKGKLAIGVAATLGVMIYYNWRERQLAKKDPEGHARLQRLKARLPLAEPPAAPADAKE